MLSRITSLVQLVCLLVSTIAASAWAEPPATVPTRVIRELDGQYTIETRPTSDGLHAGITTDIDAMSRVPLLQRLQDGSIGNSVTFEPERLEGGTWCAAGIGYAMLTIDGWKVTSAFLRRPASMAQNEISMWSKSEVLVLRDQYFSETQNVPALRQAMAERRAFETRDATPVSIDTTLLPGGASNPLGDVARRVEYTINQILPQSTPSLSFLIQPAQLDGDDAMDTLPGLDYTHPYSFVLNFGLLDNATTNNENQEAILYESMGQTGGAYAYIVDPPTQRVTSRSALPSSLNNVILGIPPFADQIPFIRYDTGVPFDYNRSNGIEIGMADAEAALMHECLHALGLISYDAAFTNRFDINSVALADIFRVAQGDGDPGLFPLAFRRAGFSTNTVMVPLVSTEYRMHDGDGKWHWRDNSLGGGLIGNMDPSLTGGENRPFILYQSDLRALDIVGYNFTPSTFGIPDNAILVSPIEAAPEVPLLPSLIWSPGVQGGSYYVTIYSNAATTDSALVQQSDVLGNTMYTLTTPLQPGTQYWWTVTAFGRNGAIATGPARSFTTTTSYACDALDFNNDSVSPDSQDFVDYLSVFGGGPCSNDPNCGDLDFNNDGVSPDSGDIESLVRVFGGGIC